MNFSLIIATFVAFLFAFDCQVEADQAAQDACHLIFGVEAGLDSYYENYGCFVHCNLHGKWVNSVANQGVNCGKNGFCSRGACAQRDGKYGQIGLTFLNASKLDRASNYYVAACIAPTDKDVEKPVKDLNRTCLNSCTSSVSQNSKNPVWNQGCVGSNNQIYDVNSRIYFDVWDYATKEYYSRVDVKIVDLLSGGQNGVPVTRKLGLFAWYGYLTTVVRFDAL